ncbi:MAG: ABC transporter permease [Thermoflexales bacterium]|nr:ABC transporter permease [Thermoflexales bacterium]
MILKYVLRSFRHRKARTLLILLSLIFAVGMVVTLSAIVDTNRQYLVEMIAQQTGGYDLALSKVETAGDQFMWVDRTEALIRQTVPSVEAILPRFQGMADIAHGSRRGAATFLALDLERDTLGRMTIVSGTTDIGPGQVVILPGTAGSFDLQVGDSFDLYYTLPTPRREGYAGSTGASSSRARANVTVVGIVTQQGLFSQSTQNAVIADLAFVQEWLGLPGRAQQVLVQWDPNLYKTTNPQVAVFQARQMAEGVRAALGDDYSYDLSKVKAIDSSQQSFAAQQSLVNVYGLMALGIVGLLVRTLIQNNVIENRRDMAVLRILGATSRRLFGMVVVEVTVLGVLGAGIGTLAGILLNNYVFAPAILASMELGGLTLRPTVSPGTILPPVLMAAGVLAISALSPARQASATKIMHAINPGAADNIGLDDIAKFRERRPSTRVFVIGLSLTIAWVVMIYGFQYAFTFGDISLIAVLIFGSLLSMVLGVAMMFSVLTVPFERLLLLLLERLAPKRAFFVTRYVKRGKERNTWISLMIVLSATLPVFLATEMALQQANLATQVQMNNGAPLEAEIGTEWGMGGFVFEVSIGGSGGRSNLMRLKPAFVDEFKATPGVERVVGLSYSYRANTADAVGVRSANVSYVGLTGSLNGIVFPDKIEFLGSGPEALDRVVAEKDTVIISEGLAQHLQVPLGGIIYVTGAGLDHKIELRVVGIARQLAGFAYQIGRNQQQASGGGSSALVSLNTFRQLSHDPVAGQPDPNEAVLARFLATMAPGADSSEVGKSLRTAFTLKHKLIVSITQEQIDEAIRSFQQAQVFMAVLAIISSVTSIFGVFAVIFVAVNSRRLEIGMMKAVGSSNGHLLLTFILEAIVMSVSAVLTGITAGAILGYVDTYSSSFMYEMPVTFAVDLVVGPLTVVLVVVASIISAAWASRAILVRKAVQILREA